MYLDYKETEIIIEKQHFTNEKKKRHWIHTIYIHIISIQWYVLFLFFS